MAGRPPGITTRDLRAGGPGATSHAASELNAHGHAFTAARTGGDAAFLNTNIPLYFLERRRGREIWASIFGAGFLVVAGSILMNALCQSAAMTRLADYYREKKAGRSSVVSFEKAGGTCGRAGRTGFVLFGSSWPCTVAPALIEASIAEHAPSSCC